jgi:hypothetical protein
MVSLEAKLLLAYLSPFLFAGLYIITKSKIKQLFLGLFYYLVGFVFFIVFLFQTFFNKGKSFRLDETEASLIDWLIFSLHTNKIILFVYLLLLISTLLFVYFYRVEKRMPSK